MDEIVEKLAGLLQRIPTEKKDQVLAEAEKVRSENIEKLGRFFNKQIQALEAQQYCPHIITEKFIDHRDQIIEIAFKLWQEKYHFQNLTMLQTKGICLFLLVIPETYLSIHTQVVMLRGKNGIGYTDLAVEDIRNIIEAPRGLYAIFDVEDGQATQNKPAKIAAQIIEEQGRRCLVTVEIISLGIHTAVLLNHSIGAFGSRDESSKEPEETYLWRGDGRPQLFSLFVEHQDCSGGTPSCDKTLTFVLGN